MRFLDLWLGGNMFYSLGELQLWVFHQNGPNSGGDTAHTPVFDRILHRSGGNFGLICGAVGGVWGRFWGYFDPPEAQKPVSSHRKPILGGFGKIDFSTIFGPFLALATPNFALYGP